MKVSHRMIDCSKNIKILPIISSITTFHILIVLAVLCMPAFGMTANDWVEKGNVFFYQSKYNGAIKAYDKAIEINPRLAGAWNNKGLTLEDIGKYDEAIKILDKAIEINPRLPEAWYNKGKALKGMGRYEEAIKAFDKAIEINPQDADSWSNKGHALFRLGKYGEAIKASDKAIEINPQDRNAENNKGTIDTMMLLNALIEPPILPDHSINSDDAAFHLDTSVFSAS
jgi:tetratricopeptide (TPR) repeat protein